MVKIYILEIIQRILIPVSIRTSTLVSGVSHDEGYDVYFDPRVWGQS